MNLNEMLELLATAPDSQIDATITPRIKALIGLPPDGIAARMKIILDECAFAALASDFAMMAMDAVWNEAKSQGRLNILI